MWGGGFNRLPIQIHIKAKVEETIDYSRAATVLVDQKFTDKIIKRNSKKIHVRILILMGLADQIFRQH